MYNTNFRRISFVLVLALMLPVLISTNVYAENTKQNLNHIAFMEVDDLEKHLEMEPQGISIGIIVGGLLIAYFIDGVIIYETGQSPGAWVADAIAFINQHINRLTTVYCSNTTVLYGADGQDCTISPGGQVWNCRYSA